MYVSPEGGKRVLSLILARGKKILLHMTAIILLFYWYLLLYHSDQLSGGLVGDIKIRANYSGSRSDGSDTLAQMAAGNTELAQAVPLNWKKLMT